ncbi:MAG: peptidogalycan biosysnthesis protein, partial [Alphaproteobacteria bacterium]
MSETFTALVLDQTGDDFSAELRSLTDANLPDGEVTVAVEYSTVNYKDGMVVKGNIGRLVRDFPHVPGIDFAGIVEHSDSDAFKFGDKVVLIVAEAEGKPVAGALNLLGREVLYGRNWGCHGQYL